MSYKEEKKNNLSAKSYSLKREIYALILFFAAVFLGGSLLSYDPGDHMIWTVTGPLGPSENLFGAVGAHIAGLSFFIVGLSVFWCVLAFLWAAFSFFRMNPLKALFRQTVSFLILIISFSGLLSISMPGQVIFRGDEMACGAGGLLGIELAALAAKLFNRFGTGLFFAAVFFIAFMSITGVSFGKIFDSISVYIDKKFVALKDKRIKKQVRKNRAQKTVMEHKKIKERPRVTIIDQTQNTEETVKSQAKFSFMNKIGGFQLPSLDMLQDPPVHTEFHGQKESLEMNARLLEKKLEDFNVKGQVVEIRPGPVITMYEFRPAPGVKISKVAGLSDDLALTLRAPSIRIVAPIPGKDAIGIEIPNNKREMVYFKDILDNKAFRDGKNKLPLALGKDITGEPVIADLTKMPHLLVAGATGAGKSVSINTMIQSILFSTTPEIVRFLMVDPKRIELSIYHDIPHLLHPVVTNAKDATKVLRWAVQEMERRYMLLSDRGARNIESYNKNITKKPLFGDSDKDELSKEKPLPYLIIIIDELADLMMTSSREVEESITRLAQMARAAGIHLIIATQRPSVDVLTGIIKANFPTRISFQVSSKFDSRTILDQQGAEHLLGAGDMLFMPPGVGKLMRIHGAFLGDSEIGEVCDFLREQQTPQYDESIIVQVLDAEGSGNDNMEKDSKYDEAVELVLKTGQASISMVQRKLGIGYNRAANIVECMEKEGLIGPSDGTSKPRKVFMKRDM